MQTMIFNPLKEFESKFKTLHSGNVQAFFEKLVQQSGVDVEENRKTVAQHNTYKENLVKLRRKLNWMRFWRVLMCISLVLIPVVIAKTTPKIKELREEITHADKMAAELLSKAYEQMMPLNALFTDRDALRLIQTTIPQINFDPCFSAQKEEDMKQNYDFDSEVDNDTSAIDVLSGSYNGNPFLFVNKIQLTMGAETYHGYKRITWTESYTDSNGKRQTRVKSETLHATVTKPKPFYSTQVELSYGAQGAPDLCFSRDASHLELDSKKEVERHVKRGEKKLKRKSAKALKENDGFTSMSNSDFEVLFDALDRTDEVQFRTLFTPLAQTNMVELILSKTGFGDDFHFFKRKRMNKIISTHSRNREINLLANAYTSYSFDSIQANFTQKNNAFFKAVYFDFAPLLAIPVYQERPVHSLMPAPDYGRKYALQECEALANLLEASAVVHPKTKTQAILKSAFVQSAGKADETSITAYSYDIEQRVDIVSVYGGDGRFHNVSVPWDEYLPLEAQSNFLIAKQEDCGNESIMARRNNLCIYKKN